MEYKKFGRTGLDVSVAGLGCGGNSRLGQNAGKSVAESVALVREAIDLGVNIFDTAANYGTEPIVGEAIKAMPRERVVVATKAAIRKGEALIPTETVIKSLEASLRHLDTDYVDVFQPHAVPPWAYDHVREKLVPALLREKEKGKIRHIGVSETSPGDHSHSMLQRAVEDDVWEVAMLGYHMMHQQARAKIFPRTMANGIGTLIMFVVRNIFSRPGHLQKAMQELAKDGLVSAELAAQENPLDFLIHEGGASSLTDAAYRFVRHTPGADVVLFGTGSREHLRTNIESILKPPLPEADVAKLHDLFGHLQGVGLELPDHHKD